jgi:hypothetical protein
METFAENMKLATDRVFHILFYPFSIFHNIDFENGKFTIFSMLVLVTPYCISHYNFPRYIRVSFLIKKNIFIRKTIENCAKSVIKLVKINARPIESVLLPVILSSNQVNVQLCSSRQLTYILIHFIYQFFFCALISPCGLYWCV